MDKQRHLCLGQSLVEFAIILPILIFFLLGIFEVGIALRNYVVLVNANREAARFAVRPGYLDLEGKTYEEIGYQDVYQHTYQAIANQLFMDYLGNSQMVINIVRIDTGQPCDPVLREEPKYHRKDSTIGNWYEVPASETYQPTGDWPKFKVDYWPNCDCDVVATSPYTPYIVSDHFNNPVYQYRLPISAESRIDIKVIEDKLTVENDVFNCKAMKKIPGIVASQLDTVIVEIIYQHYQVFGIPVLSNPLTDPIEMYTHTTMRHTQIRKSPFDSGEYDGN